MKEIYWIDWVKLLCIFFVYWHHVAMFSSNGSPVYIPYGPFFVNAFFFVSGYLIFRKQLSDPILSMDRSSFIKSCFRNNGMLVSILFKIAIPSIIFSMIDFVPKSIMRGEAITTETFVIDTLLRGTNWFTCALCVAELVLVLLLWTRIKNVWVYLVLSLPFVILGCYLLNEQVTVLCDAYLPWFYKSGFIALFFLAVGGIYFKFEPFLDIFVQRVGGGIFSVLLIIAYYVVYTYTPVREIKTSVLEGINLYGFPVSLISIFVIVYFFKLLKTVSLVKYISRHTIGFYFFSASIPYIWCMFTNKYIPVGSIAFVVGVIGAFSTALLIVYLLNKYLPFVFDLRKIWQ